MPMVGLGLWKIPKEKCADTVFNAISAGYRLLDSACDYGNEVEVGHGIKKALDAGVVKREDLWVTSKLWNTYHRKEHAVQACKKTLADLGLEYLDLYLIHFPIHLKFVPFEVYILWYIYHTYTCVSVALSLSLSLSLSDSPSL
jgi:D-xylose reductase